MLYARNPDRNLQSNTDQSRICASANAVSKNVHPEAGWGELGGRPLAHPAPEDSGKLAGHRSRS